MTRKPLVTFLEKYCWVHNEAGTPTRVLIRQMPSLGYGAERRARLQPSRDSVYSFAVIHGRPRRRPGCCTLSPLCSLNLELKQQRQEGTPAMEDIRLWGAALRRKSALKTELTSGRNQSRAASLAVNWFLDFECWFPNFLVLCGLKTKRGLCMTPCHRFNSSTKERLSRSNVFHLTHFERPEGLKWEKDKEKDLTSLQFLRKKHVVNISFQELEEKIHLLSVC